MQPTKNPTVAFTGPFGSIVVPTCSMKDGAVLTTLRPVSLIRAATSWCRGRVNPCLVCERPEFLDRFSRDLDLLGAGHKAGLAARAGEKAVADRIRYTGSGVAGIECKPHLLPHRSGPKETRDVHGRADRDARQALDAIPERFYLLDLRYRGQSAWPPPAPGQATQSVAIFGRRSTTRSFLTGRFSGVIVMPSVASFMHASTGSPSTRTAQLPHCPDPQQYRYASVGSISSWIACRTCRTRAPSLMLHGVRFRTWR